MQLERAVGVAGWGLRKEQAALFDAEGTHLQRYASRFSCVEINSSFYRSHRRQTYERWAASVPAAFRFLVKMPKTVTHDRLLAEPGDDLRQFFHEIEGLGDKLGCVLIQLPPRLAYDPRTVETFLAGVRRRHRGAAVCEPRHPSWFTGAADDRLAAHRIGRVLADPLCDAGAAEPGGWARTLYIRLHGSPVMYHSAYEPAYLDAVAGRLRAAAATCDSMWCIFDNTARGAATTDALALIARLGEDMAE
jgi:uncharacterized protein YecE (DUF72 family)